MSSWHNYTEIFNLGHAAIKELFFDPVLIEEKIDGSQINFCKMNEEIFIRSKGADIFVDKDGNSNQKMFQAGVDTILSLDLHEGWTYRAEYLAKPKHNVLAYDRVPEGHIIIFDINVGEEEYLSYEEKILEAERLGLETVPIIAQNEKVTNVEKFKTLLKRESILGKQTIEGVVIKNYARFGKNKKALMGKYVSEKYREVHQKHWAGDRTGGVIEQIIAKYKTEARWEKAIIHLKEKGELQEAVQDIGPLMKEVHLDIRKECEDEIKEMLFKWAWKRIGRACCSGLPEWYKEKLLEKQFDIEKEI